MRCGWIFSALPSLHSTSAAKSPASREAGKCLASLGEQAGQLGASLRPRRACLAGARVCQPERSRGKNAATGGLVPPGQYLNPGGDPNIAPPGPAGRWRGGRLVPRSGRQTSLRRDEPAGGVSHRPCSLPFCLVAENGPANSLRRTELHNCRKSLSDVLTVPTLFVKIWIYYVEI